MINVQDNYLNWRKTYQKLGQRYNESLFPLIF